MNAIKRQSGKERNTVGIRKAKISDIKAIHRIINESAKRQEMLPRSLSNLYEHVRDFIVFGDESLKGLCALHVCWEEMAEIRSLVVDKQYRMRGIGDSLIKQALKEARSLGIKKVFALTYAPDFFERFGFTEIDKTELPHKIWGDCLNCPKFPDCDETAVLKKL